MKRNQVPGTRNQGFRGLLAWQKADELASAIYRTVGSARADRWIISQTVRAAISVPANIAEGYGRGTIGDYTHFLDIARGSLAEVEYYLLFLEREEIISAVEAERLNDLQHETARILHGLWRSLKDKARNGAWDRSGMIQEEPALYAADGEDSSIET